MRMFESGTMYSPGLAEKFAATHQDPSRILTYRDIPGLLEGYEIKKVLDFGCGSGGSTSHFANLGYETVGVDKNPSMINYARRNFPHLPFFLVESLKVSKHFDLVSSIYVLFELKTKQEIISHLNKVASFLKEGGLFLAVTGSIHMYSRKHHFACFNADFPENNTPTSGQVVKVTLKDANVGFYDYYWTENDYKECFDLSDLTLKKIHYPLGLETDNFSWKDERTYGPYVCFVAQKKKLSSI